MVDACETPMEDHIKRFHELLKVPGAIVRVDTPNPLGYDTAHFGEGFACSLSLRVEAEKRAREEALEDAADKSDEIAMLRDSEARWIARIAVVRHATGDNGRMMLPEFTKWFNARWAELLAAETHSAALARALEEATSRAYAALVTARAYVREDMCFEVDENDCAQTPEFTLQEIDAALQAIDRARSLLAPKEDTANG